VTCCFISHIETLRRQNAVLPTSPDICVHNEMKAIR
jgi:hypothetical protein